MTPLVYQAPVDGTTFWGTGSPKIMTISDCLGAADARRHTHTLDATLDAPAKRRELLEPMPTATRYLRAIDLRIPIASDTIDHSAATCDAAIAA